MELIREKYLSKIREYYESNLIKVLTGIRRSGKSVLLKQIHQELISSNKTDANHIIEINLEDMQYSKITSAEKLNACITKKINDDKKYYIFIDEIQHVRQFEKVLASLKATKNVSLFVTGSNSKLLSGKLATLLVGRCIEFKIMPFSYSEYIEFCKINDVKIFDDPFIDYLKFGGMPQRFEYNSVENIKKYLKGIYDGIIVKDICGPHSKVDLESFDLVSKYIMSNIAKEFSSDKISKYFSLANDTPLYRETVYRYLEKMESACLISRVKRFDVATKRALKSIEKQFAVDTGFIMSSISGSKIELTHALENVIYNELVYQGFEVYIGKTYKGEVDFVAIKDGKKCFIQVAYYLIDEEVIKRVFSSFSPIKDHSPKYVFSLDKFDMSQDGITHVNVEKFLKGEVALNIS